MRSLSGSWNVHLDATASNGLINMMYVSHIGTNLLMPETATDAEACARLMKKMDTALESFESGLSAVTRAGLLDGSNTDFPEACCQAQFWVADAVQVASRLVERGVMPPHIIAEKSPGLYDMMQTPEDYPYPTLRARDETEALLERLKAPRPKGL